MGFIDIFNKTLRETSQFKITHPIRLIELFGGIGSQAMALRDLGVNFTHHKLVEFDEFAIKTYNAIHGTSFITSDITQIKGTDLDIVDTDKYDYIMTYSFPCTDLSSSGLRQGMSKGSGTRSGLLWEVERLLEETKELPQVLVMENVVNVHNKTNMSDFSQWMSYLNTKGYTSKYFDMSPSEVGIPQSRGRCFMVSVLNGSYQVPHPSISLKEVDSFLEHCNNEKDYLDNPRAEKYIDSLNLDIEKDTFPKAINLNNNGLVRTIKAQYYKNGMANLEKTDSGFACTGVVDIFNNELRIRKLSPRECWRLMGYTDSDFDKAKQVNPNTWLYKQAGNAIVKQCLMAILKNLL